MAHAQASTQGGEAAGAQGQLWSCAEVGGPMPTVSATAPATATRRPPSPILTHRLRWRIAAHLVGDEVFTFGRPRCLYCKRGQLQGRKVRPPPASSLLGLPEPPLLSSPPSRLRRSSSESRARVYLRRRYPRRCRCVRRSRGMLGAAGAGLQLLLGPGTSGFDVTFL